MTVRMSDEDTELVRKYVRFEGTTISEFARSAMLEKIEDHAGLQELRAAIEADDGQRLSLNDVLEELDLCQLAALATASNSQPQRGNNSRRWTRSMRGFCLIG
ncbi:DUF6290 family protein [Corynebacterium phoceense]|nr:DUF6290 family protein [Corynebacterium phoceense]MCQ9340919.1 DUF6290 family protein [Corynebacterium phoceense]MCQ9345633.1 DUF6290 family protein [Corynebacterium phoceense]